MAFNVLYSAEDMESSVQVIEAEAPDIVCLREVTPRFVKAFERRSSDHYPHRRFFPRTGTWGAGLASKYPIRNASVFPGRPHRLPAMTATVDLPTGPVLVLCLHLFPPVGKHRASDSMFETFQKNATLRRQQAEYLMARFGQSDIPTILLGDMNELRGDDALQTFLKAGFRHFCDAPDADCGATYPGPAIFLPAVVQIDHILGRGITFTAGRVVHGGGSDHFPVIAQFRL